MFIIEGVKKWAKTSRIALVKEGDKMSYESLEKRSESIAAFILDVAKDKIPVILWGDKENDMVSCMIACLKSGRAYVIIPNYFPAERAQAIITAAKSNLIFNVSKDKIPVQDITTVYSEELDTIEKRYEGVEVSSEHWVKPDDLCCIFYTSGSTGDPKGVMITRRNLEACIAWKYPFGNLSPETENEGLRSLNFSPYNFSASIERIYRDLGALGTTLYGVDKKLASDFKRLFDFILEVQPHYFGSTPSFMDICCRNPQFTGENIPEMRLVNLGGEVVPPNIAKNLLTRFPKVKLLCTFGATEITSGTLNCWITQEMLESGKPLPIGKPSFNSSAYVADESGNSLPEGEVGELVIISEMVSQGYLNDPIRTAQKFFLAEDGQRGYRTGDLVWREGDMFYYVGRMDNQVKVGGYRVELEDVERHLRKVSLIQDCAVAPVMENGRVVMLTAFVILKDPTAKQVQSIITIRKEIAGMVQAYMIPQKIVFMESLPRNSNNKLDRKALIEIANKNAQCDS